MADQIQLSGLGGAPAKSGRLAYIDWMRGLACVVMFQAHCYNSWLSPEARKSPLYIWSQLAATLPAPLFLFLAGISFAMVTQRWREKGTATNAIARTTIWRGAEIYGLGLLFRVQEFLLGYPNSPWTDLLRVDVLNIIGMSMMFMGVLCWLTTSRTAQARDGSRTDETTPDLRQPGVSNQRAILVQSASIANSRDHAILWSLIGAAVVALATPLLWTTVRPSWLPWPLESYINGVHIYNKPQPWLFPLFPWCAFGFAGLAVGFFLFSDFAKRKQVVTFFLFGTAGVLACVLSLGLDAGPLRLYPAAIYDYWHTSPNFFLLRCGILLVVLFLVYAWCRWGLGQWGFSPLIQLGNTSLLVYWVHIEFVYGRFSILPKGQCGIWKATGGLLVIFLAMLGLSMLRTRWKKRPAKALERRQAPAAVTTESG